MEQFFIFIKHHFSFIWRVIELANGISFELLYQKKLDLVVERTFKNIKNSEFEFRLLDSKDANELSLLIKKQNPKHLDYFKPHGFDLRSIQKQIKVKAFLMMGVFDNQKLIGYFFLRFFTTGKSFVGRMIDTSYRGKGIGAVMNTIMYQISWNMGFKCQSTISKDNKLVMKAHENNPSLRILKELPNNYLLVEFIDNI